MSRSIKNTIIEHSIHSKGHTAFHKINLLVTELTTGGSMVKLKKIAQFFAFLGRVRSFSIALMVENASLTAMVTR